MKKVSVIIPVYNEQNSISECLESLKHQTYENLEIIIVDDGSTDKTNEIVKKFKVSLLVQNHKGPGVARNLGAEKADGDILVFVDADMTFDKNFVKDLVAPILENQTIGTFSKNEYVSNADKIWSYCWNINRNAPKNKMLPTNYPDKAPVYRAILKKEFVKVGGFELSGDYTDDWSLSEKLGKKSTVANGAIYYHKNPETFSEVWQQASWIGKNRFMTSTYSRKFKSLVMHSLPVSIFIGIFKSVLRVYPPFFIFKIFYDFSIFLSVVKSFGKITFFK